MFPNIGVSQNGWLIVTNPIEMDDLEGNTPIFRNIHMCQGLNSHYFPIIGDKLINPIIGFYIPIIRIPSLKVGGFPSPRTKELIDPGQKRQKR